MQLNSTSRLHKISLKIYDFLLATDVRNADNFESDLKHWLVNNDLIIENIFKWLEPSQVIKCSQVCLKWKHFSQLITYKRKYFSHKLLYFGLLSTKESQEFSDKYRSVYNLSLEDMTDSFNWFIWRNRIMEFKVIIVFSKLDYNQLKSLLTTQCIPNDSTIIHINCRNEVIGSQLQSQKTLRHIECEPDFDVLSGISALFISTSLSGIEVKLYEDSKIFEMKKNEDLKCILVFHIWRSLYGHFSRLKTDSEYVESLENFVNSFDNSLAFGGVTVERVVTSEINSSDDSYVRISNKFLDYICCLTFSGPRVRAFSFVIDFNTNIETQLQTIEDQISPTSGPHLETIGFIFDENISHSTHALKNHLKNSITFMGCAGLSHGLNSIQVNDCFTRNKNLFFRRGKCVLVVIQLNKKF